jgi:hypothetical protein
MKKYLLFGLLIAMVVIAGCAKEAEAMLDDKSVLKDSTNQLQGQIAEGGDANQQQGQGQGQLQGQAQGQGQGQAQGQAAIAAQGQIGINEQIQGNLGIQKGNDVSTDVNVEGDSGDTYANAWPSLSGGEGVSQANAYSVFGGLGLSNTEPYKAYITQIQAIEASKALDTETKAVLVGKLVDKMVESNKDKRFLGLFWKTSGRNLSNLFGILAFDSFWKEDQHPFTKQGE